MTVGNYTFNQFALQIDKHQKQINLAVIILLSVYLLAYAAELTWRLIPAPEQQSSTGTAAPATQGNRTARTNNGTDISALTDLNLFGDVDAKPQAAPVVTEAPKTRLNLTLTGVVASSETDGGAAIIENKGTQNTYGIGDKIDGTNAVLVEVYPERVIIKNGQRRETLMLDGVDYTKQPAASEVASRNTAPQGQPQSQRRTLSSEALRATRNVRNRPSSFSDFIAISPVRQNGQLEGYRVSPGKDPSLFKSAGLKSGDIITEINGLDLTDMQQSMEAMGALQQAQSLQMTVNRGGETVSLYLDIPSKELEL